MFELYYWIETLESLSKKLPSFYDSATMNIGGGFGNGRHLGGIVASLRTYSSFLTRFLPKRFKKINSVVEQYIFLPAPYRLLLTNVHLLDQLLFIGQKVIGINFDLEWD